MLIYFLLVKIVAMFGHKKASLLVDGQASTLGRMRLDIPRIRVDSRPLAWFHASSVGEFEQARPIIERLRAEKTHYIILTFFSPSGYEMRKDYNQVDAVYYLPFATKKNAKALLDLLQPSVVLFAKYEFWPAYLKELQRRGIATYSFSAIFRPGQLFFLPWGRWYLNLLKCFTHIFVQDEASMILLQRHGICSVSVAGDTRFDRVNQIASQSRSIPEIETFVDGRATLADDVLLPSHDRIIVAGSTWPEDEELLARYIDNRPDVRLILVPHEIDEAHLHTIFHLFKGRYVRFTEATRNSVNQCRVVVVDTMGLLSSLYRYACVGYIGGGFGVGIHNTLEAAVYGIPVLFGPNYHKFREAKGLLAVGAGRVVATYDELEKAMDECLDNCAEIGQKSREYVDSELGATDKIYSQCFGKGE